MNLLYKKYKPKHTSRLLEVHFSNLHIPHGLQTLLPLNFGPHHTGGSHSQLCVVIGLVLLMTTTRLEVEVVVEWIVIQSGTCNSCGSFRENAWKQTLQFQKCSHISEKPLSFVVLGARKDKGLQKFIAHFLARSYWLNAYRVIKPLHDDLYPISCHDSMWIIKIYYLLLEFCWTNWMW